jgi:hypothetical protein
MIAMISDPGATVQRSELDDYRGYYGLNADVDPGVDVSYQAWRLGHFSDLSLVWLVRRVA